MEIRFTTPLHTTNLIQTPYKILNQTSRTRRVSYSMNARLPLPPWNQFRWFVLSCSSIQIAHTQHLFAPIISSVTQTFASFFKLKYSLWDPVIHIERMRWEKRERKREKEKKRKERAISNRQQDREHISRLRCTHYISYKLFIFRFRCTMCVTGLLAGCI